jgi:molybdenum cofactor cytidylyltransferase
MRLAAVVPAAGLSLRMGREKILLPFGRSTVLETILEALRSAGVSDIAAVVRPDLPRAALLARKAGVAAVENPHPEGEMLLSIRLGLGALPPGSDAVFVWPADHPAVSGATVDLLASLADPGRVLLPTYLSRRGHPALVGRDLLADISRIPAGEGLRHLWRARARDVVEVPVDDPGVIQNIDTPEEYEKALARAGAARGSEEPET